MTKLLNSASAVITRRLGRSLAPMWLIMCAMIGLVAFATLSQ